MDQRQRKLPPLPALRAFEAGARLGSFTLAANELHVTQTAISHQVRGLERFYAQKLFVRSGRQLALTAAGEQLAAHCTEWLDQLHKLSQSLLSPSEENPPLRVTLAPSLGARWLAPRLASLWAQHALSLNLIPSGELLDFHQQDIDFGLRVGDGQWPGLCADYLMPMCELPACAPARLAQAPLQNPEDLTEHPLLHEFSYHGWQQWVQKHRATGVDAQQGTLCQDPNMLVQMAIAGQGVALVNPMLWWDLFERGELVLPLGDRARLHAAYYLVYRAHSLKHPRTRCFRQFILDEAERTRKAQACSPFALQYGALQTPDLE